MYIVIEDIKKKEEKKLSDIVINMEEDEAVIITSDKENFSAVVFCTEYNEFIYSDSINKEFSVLNGKEETKDFFHPITYSLPHDTIIRVVKREQITLNVKL